MKGVYSNNIDLQQEYNLASKYESMIMNYQTKKCNYCNKDIFNNNVSI